MLQFPHCYPHQALFGLFIKDACTAYCIFFGFFPFRRGWGRLFEGGHLFNIFNLKGGANSNIYGSLIYSPLNVPMPNCSPVCHRYETHSECMSVVRFKSYNHGANTNYHLNYRKLSRQANSVDPQIYIHTPHPPQKAF